jgi:hypothetical protein
MTCVQRRSANRIRETTLVVGTGGAVRPVTLCLSAQGPRWTDPTIARSKVAPNGTELAVTLKGDCNNAQGSKSLASSLLHDDVAEAGKASAAFAATVRDVFERWAHQKFFFGELQSLCKLHHESAKKRDENRGDSTQIGADGWPVDPRHPFYSRGRGA